jgi:hypothetical protein
VIHRVLVSDKPVDTVWARDFAHLLLAGLTSHTGQASHAESAESG